MRDWKGKDLPMKLFLALHRFVELNDTSHGNSHTVSVLSVGNIESRGVALHLACEEREVHPRRSHEVGSKFGPNLTHERFELF